MSNLTVVNYDENGSFAKKIHDEGEDMTQVLSHTRQMVHALHNEWVGEAAEAFFEEMEAELLPAVQRVINALFLSEEILNKVVKIIHDADEETARFFKEDLNSDFGAGLFGQAGALGGLAGLGGLVGGAAGADFGAGKFEEALGGETGAGEPEGGDSGADPDAVSIAPAPEMSRAEMAELMGEPVEPQPAEAGAGGGGGSAGDSGQGDLKGLGSGIGAEPQQVSAGGAGGPQAMPDHIFEGGAAGGGGQTPQGGSAGGSGVPQEQSAGGIGAAAGIAGGLAAAGGIGKAIKDGLDKSDQ